MDLVSDIGDNKAIGGGYVGAIPASFATQMALANGVMRQSQQRTEESEMLSRVMMARMNTLEEGFREVVYEVRETMRQAVSRPRSPERMPPLRVQREKERKQKDKARKEGVLADPNKTVAEGEGGIRPGTSGSGNGSNKENQKPPTTSIAADDILIQRSNEETQRPTVESGQPSEGEPPASEHQA